MKILFAHVVHSPGVDRWYRSIADSAPDGVEVTPFCITLDSPGARLSWSELDRRWARRDRQLLNLYDRLQDAAQDCDVLLNYNGVNIHPDLLSYLPTFNVYGCFDDPEASHSVSQPVASAFDAVFFGNAASRFQYEGWGCKRLAWLPIFNAPGDVPGSVPKQEIFRHKRGVDIAMVGAVNPFRERRMEALAKAFPQAQCYGDGWPNGRISDRQMHELYRCTRIGWNVHNSTGPINRRLFALAGFGVMPLCDNKTGLGQIFKLGEEAVGFDTIPEAIELTHYYLKHEDERRRISEAAYDRFWRDYHATAIWSRIAEQLRQWEAVGQKPQASRLPRPNHLQIVTDTAVFARRQGGRVVRAAKRAINADGHLPTKRRRIDESFYIGKHVTPYHENTEMRGVNMAEQRLDNGDPLDWPNILALNWAVTSLIGKATRIVEVGSGTGPFAEYASTDRARTIDCLEDDEFARGQAIKLRSRPNVRYRKTSEVDPDRDYELLVSVEVIEHVADLSSFLSFCRRMAPRAIFSTPNRLAVRGCDDTGPPPYAPHVREFSAGELYWLLRHHYASVNLYHMPDVFVPWLEPMTIADQGTPIIAECIGSLPAAEPASCEGQPESLRTAA